MSRRRHGIEQIIGKLREAEADLAPSLTVDEVCRELGIGEQTHYRWRREFGAPRLTSRSG